MAIYKLSRRKFLIVAGSLAAISIAGNGVMALEEISRREVGKSRYKWAMVVDVEKCTKCMERLIAKTGNEHVKPPCVEACDKENNVPEFKNKSIDPQWIRIIKFKSNTGLTIYMPVLCNQCEYPPCVQVCPTQASFKRDDGIVLIDYHRCIGCRYCMVACPYGARTFNFEDPLKGLPNSRPTNPSVPTRGHGVPEKCTFCVHRIDLAIKLGKNPIPACVEACPENALVFGNLKDPNSEVSKIVREHYVVQLRADLGTNPHVYYYNLVR